MHECLHLEEIHELKQRSNETIQAIGFLKELCAEFKIYNQWQKERDKKQDMHEEKIEKLIEKLDTKILENEKKSNEMHIIVKNHGLSINKNTKNIEVLQESQQVNWVSIIKTSIVSLSAGVFIYGMGELFKILKN